MVVVDRRTQKALNRKAGAGRITSGPLSQTGDEPGRRSAAKLLTRDEARQVAGNVSNAKVTHS